LFGCAVRVLLPRTDVERLLLLLFMVVAGIGLQTRSNIDQPLIFVGDQYRTVEISGKSRVTRPFYAILRIVYYFVTILELAGLPAGTQPNLQFLRQWWRLWLFARCTFSYMYFYKAPFRLYYVVLVLQLFVGLSAFVMDLFSLAVTSKNSVQLLQRDGVSPGET